jgi:hypothetical protein
MTIIYEPFTDKQIKSINEFQRSKHWHPFTCGKVHCDGILTATKHGVVCRKCGNWRQTWVHDFMADNSWKKLDMLQEAAEKSIEEYQRVKQCLETNPVD